MKRNLILAAIFALALAASASAQKAADFSGTWTIDVAKSSPAETMIEGGTMTIVQTANDIKVGRNFKIKEGATPQGRGPGGPSATTYGIGNAIKTTRETPNGAVEISFIAKIDGNKLSLTTATPMGERGETFTMNADGTLTSESKGRDGAVMTRTYRKS